VSATHETIKHKALPFLLSGFIIAADQLVKGFIVTHWTGNRILDVFGNDVLWIIHVRNKAIAFSLGHNLPDTLRPFLFIILPIGVIIGLILGYYCKSREISPLQRWLFAGIIGGGLGNILDRIFRPDGVVDFISIKFYGLFGMERWPTFNIADASVVVCCIIFFVSSLISPKSSALESPVE
jgi:signal peptidase II